MKPKPKPARPIEFTFVADCFNLAIEDTEDGARRQAELDAIRANDERQTTIPCPQKNRPPSKSSN